MAIAGESGRGMPVVADAAPRVKLLIQSGPRAGTEIPCRRVVTLLGRRPGCKVHLEHPWIAPVHVAIVNTGAEIMAVDLLTKGGTTLNDLKMEHERLSHGDVIGLDPWAFRVEIRRPRGNGHDDEHPFELEPTPPVVAYEHLDSGRILQPKRDVCIIGRRSGSDIQIKENQVSRAHALVFAYYGYPVLFDLMSGNHSYVNDDPIDYRVLQDNDIIRIGDSRFRVRFAGTIVAERAKKQSPPAKPPAALEPVEHAGDLIDIKETEGSQRWGIAEKLEKTAPNR